MEVTADLVKYGLLKNRSPEEIFEEIFEDDSLSDDIFVLSAYELSCGWSDSALYFGTTGDTVKKLLETDLDNAQRNSFRIKEGYACLFLYEFMPDELNLRSVPDENYIASFSPETAQGMLSHWTEFAHLGLLKELSKSEIGEHSGAYLNQWKALVECASAKNLGVLIHCG